MYDFDVSPGTLNAVTDKLLPVIAHFTPISDKKTSM
jgi:hypothetical protein